MTQAMCQIPQAGDEFSAEDVEPNDTSAVSSEVPDSDSSSQDGSDASASDDEAPTPTAVRTAARQLEAHILGPGDGEEIREGRTRAQTRAFNREAAAGLISVIGPCEEGSVFQALLAANKAECEKNEVAGLPCQRGGIGTNVIHRSSYVEAFGRLDGRDKIGV